MAAVPITFQGIMYPRNKTVPPYQFTAIGLASITGLEVGGGPILPPDEVPIDPPIEPPLVIWPNPPEGIAPLPEHPIVYPPPPPERPPAQAEPPHEGWNWSAAKSGWYFLYIPGPTDPQPKKPSR